MVSVDNVCKLTIQAYNDLEEGEIVEDDNEFFSVFQPEKGNLVQHCENDTNLLQASSKFFFFQIE